jgi:hypothetical protein
VGERSADFLNSILRFGVHAAQRNEAAGGRVAHKRLWQFNATEPEKIHALQVAEGRTRFDVEKRHRPFGASPTVKCGEERGEGRRHVESHILKIEDDRSFVLMCAER